MNRLELSHSKIQTYARCPLLYKLVFIEGWRSPPNPSQALGQSLHRTLAAFLTPSNDDKSLDGLFVLFDQNWVNEGFPSAESALTFYESGRTILGTFFNIIPRRDDVRFLTEVEFHIPVGEVDLRGSIDRVDLLPDGSAKVVEYKTRDVAWDDVRIRRDPQLTIYEMGARQGLGLEHLSLEYQFLEQGRAVPTTRTDSDREEIMEQVKTTAEGIGCGSFSPNTEWCHRCEFSQRCSFSSVRTK